METKVVIKTLEQMTAFEAYEIFKLRQEVFVQEQEITEADIDETDQICNHLTVFADGQLAAYCRFFKDNGNWFIGRVVTKKSLRRHHLGSYAVNAVHDYLKSIGAKQVYLHAQEYIIPFYESLGYSKQGDVFLEAGIRHQLMTKQL